MVCPQALGLQVPAMPPMYPIHERRYHALSCDFSLCAWAGPQTRRHDRAHRPTDRSADHAHALGVQLASELRMRCGTAINVSARRTRANRYSFDAKSKVSTWLIEETDMQQDCSFQSTSESDLARHDFALADSGLGLDRTYHEQQ